MSTELMSARTNDSSCCCAAVCVLLLHVHCASEQASLNLLWHVCCRAAGGQAQRSSSCTTGTLCHAGTVPVNKIPDLVQGIAKNLRQRLSMKQSTNGKGPGFNYTPGLVLAVCGEVLGWLAAAEEHQEPSAQPLPGFTDVGQHTGCEPRATSWPLVREVHKVRGVISRAGAVYAMRDTQPAPQHVHSYHHHSAKLHLAENTAQQHAYVDTGLHDGR
jgi:hypothetical protein